jgi:hypothetical protein
MTTKHEHVITVYDDKGNLNSIIKTDEAQRKNTIYNTVEADLEQIEALFNGKN